MRDADASTRRRPRPVPDAPVAPYARGTGLAKAWLLALMQALPLQDAGRVPTATLGSEGPALCRAICAAVTGDEGLRRLDLAGADAGLAARVPAMTGARTPAALHEAVDVLREVVLGALLGELRSPSGAEVAALAERVAHVTAVVTAGALEALEAPVAPTQEAEDPVAAAPPEGVVSLQDVRGARSSWRAAVERRLEHHVRDRRPFTLLLLELDDLHVLLAAHEADELVGVIHELERTVQARLSPGDQLVREEPGRYWVLLGEPDEAAAREIARELAAAIRVGAVLQGAGLTVSVGVAACPRDGTAVDALAERADEGVFLARAAGLPVTG